MDNRTEEVITRFQDSWKETQRTFELFETNGFEKLKPVEKFISELKENGKTIISE